jgi:hypothetical protein
MQSVGVIERVRAEFLEIPCLSLTHDQLRRFVGLNRNSCDRYRYSTLSLRARGRSAGGLIDRRTTSFQRSRRYSFFGNVIVNVVPVPIDELT